MLVDLFFKFSFRGTLYQNVPEKRIEQKIVLFMFYQSL